jgi:hypothetical protein
MQRFDAKSFLTEQKTCINCGKIWEVPRPAVPDFSTPFFCPDCLKRIEITPAEQQVMEMLRKV